MRSILSATIAALTIVWHLSGTAAASSFNEVTTARFTLEGTAKFTRTGQVQTGVLGQGFFTYTPNNWVKTYEFPFTDGSVVLTETDNFRLVTQFQANLFGKQFGPSFSGGGGGTSSAVVDYLWKLPLNAGDQFPGGGITPGAVRRESGGGPEGHYASREQWSFGISSVIIDMLTLEQDGTWTYHNSGGPGEEVNASGTWTATPESVPEPLTLAATGLAVMGGMIFRKLRKHADRPSSSPGGR